MTSAEQILFRIEGMRATVSKVTLEWEPADPSRVDAARTALETSLPDLRGLLANIPSDVRLSRAAEGLRNEISRLQFLVDAASAFVRSAAAAQGQSYTLSGEIGPASPAAATAAYTG
jgi:hypothetical protein